MSEGRNRVRLNHAILLAMTATLLLACSREDRLEGQRLDIRASLDEPLVNEDGTPIPEPEFVNRVADFKAPRQTNLSSWTHRNGNAQHNLPHLALSPELTRLWTVDIGKGNSPKYRLTAEPVVANGLVYTLDSQSHLKAHSLIGAEVWSRDLVPVSDSNADATGGGLAYADGVIYATTGFGEVIAMSADTGAHLWTQKLGAVAMAPPTVVGKHVYVVARDNKAWALNVKNGRIVWNQQSAQADLGQVGGAAPAVAGRQVFLPFSSGEMIAAFTNNGLRVWSVAISGSRLGLGRSSLGDITSDPVVSGARVYAANQSGRMTAVNSRSGERLWTSKQGAYSPALVFGNAVFIVSDALQLVRLDGRNGETVWAVDLPGFVERRERRHKTVYASYGPVLAGGRLLVASGDGLLRGFDPESGDLISQTEIPGGAASAPVIVDGVLYIVSSKGQLHAFK